MGDSLSYLDNLFVFIIRVQQGAGYGQNISHVQDRLSPSTTSNVCVMCLLVSLTKIMPTLDPFYIYIIFYFFPTFLCFLLFFLEYFHLILNPLF